MDIRESAGYYGREIQMCVHGVRSVKTKGVSEVEAAIEKAFSAIAEPQPDDASIRVGDGGTFVSLEPEKQEELLKKALT